MSDVYFEVFDIMCMHSNRFGIMIGPMRARVTISLSLSHVGIVILLQGGDVGVTGALP